MMKKGRDSLEQFFYSFLLYCYSHHNPLPRPYISAILFYVENILLGFLLWYSLWRILKIICRSVVKNLFYVVCEVLWPLPIKEIEIQACIVVLGITNGTQNFYFSPLLPFLQVEKWRMFPLLIYIYNCQMWSQL